MLICVLKLKLIFNCFYLKFIKKYILLHSGFGHPLTGIAQIPLSLWKKVQENENNVWINFETSNDRGQEHLEGFNNYKDLPSIKIKIIKFYNN